ncbi:hypothetical protein NQZ68_013296 [Dissostichus eleginoides]|nr:hypothetical protein NQZ68_013296 [Dissostichus eleginoides]
MCYFRSENSSSLAGSLRYNLEFKGRVLDDQLREARGRRSHSLPGHCQSGQIQLKEIVLREQEPPSGSQDSRLRISHTTGHPLFSEEAWL